MMKTLIIFLCLLNFAFSKRQIPIGAIFHDDPPESEIAFRYAIKRVNMYESGFELVPHIRNVLPHDSFKTERIVCELMAEGVAAIFGPGTPETSGITSSICNAVEVPHIITHWERESSKRYKETPFTLNLYPDTDMLSRAYADLLVDYTWRSYTIIYDEDDSLTRLKDILQIHNPQSSPITVRHLGDGPDYRPLLKQIQVSGESHIILDIDLDKVLTILRQASEVKMMEEYQSYIITSLDTHTLDFEDLKFMRANITAMRLIDPTSYDVTNAIHDWELGERQFQRNFRIVPESVKAETALYHDAVRLFAAAVRELDATEEIETTKIDCEEPEMWEHGKRIAEYMRLRTDTGITGRIVFNDDGKREFFQLEITELSRDGFKKIGTWDPENQVSYTRSLGEAYDQVIESLQNKTFIVASRLGVPFLSKRVPEEGEVLEGNARFEGYSMDLIDAISKILRFSYRFEIVPDGKYGSYNKQTKQWDGLVRHLLDRKADLAICDLTITYERRTAVDFTMPFMTLGISILFLNPTSEPPDLFSFLLPFSSEVWIYMMAAYIGVSLLLFALSRMAPDDWEASHPCDKEPQELENIWNILNCVWLTMGSIMGQGCDILPKATSTRIVCGMWWFFALIMLASYTANLAAFLTMTRMEASIKSAEDLAKQSKIKYGTVKGGSTMKFFQDSDFATYQRMWASMESTRPSVFVNNNDEGRERVKKGKGQYAYLMESTMLEYFTERYCDLTQIGGLLDSKSYGIALPLNSPYRTAISGAVLKLQEDGKLSALKEKWWKGGMCQKQDSGGSDDAAELGIDNVGGVFLVLGFGCFFALFVAILEFLWNVKKVAVEQKLTPWEALKSELLFAVNIWITTKPVVKMNSRLSECDGESLKSVPPSQKSISVAQGSGSKEKSVHSVNLNGDNSNNNGTNGFTSRSISHLNRIGNFFGRKSSP